MKILKGVFKGIELAVPQDGSVRPTVDHFKKHILRLAGNPKVVWDLFCGCGGVGLEFLSQGAIELVFVEHSKKALDCVTLNLAECQLKEPGVFSQKKIEKILLPVEHFIKDPKLQNVTREPDLIFLDPPYDQGIISKVLPLLLNLTSLKTQIIIEHATSEKIPESCLTSITLLEVYGPKTLTVLNSPA